MKMNLQTNAVDLSAKLLAGENISIRRARSRTASFDIKSRVLTIPMWKDMTPEIEGMLVGHEVGHALYTGDEYTVPIIENPKMMSYLNVLEDVRIEKLLKRKYPGIRKTMLEGYRQLNERDFFGISNSHLRTLNLIDRINLYFKAGYSCGVTFTSEEKPFVVRAEKTELIEDVIQLAHDIYGYSMEQARARINLSGDEEELEPEEDNDQDDPDDNYEFTDSDDLHDEDDDGEFDDRTEDEKAEAQQATIENGKAPSSSPKQTPEEKQQEQLDKELESLTDKTLEENLAQLAIDSTEYLYYNLDTKFIIDPIVPYKTILSDVAMQYDRCERLVNSIDDFNLEANRVVSYLNKEFEMKKSATMYKRATTSKIGSLDMKKVWSYKLNTDLFKRVTSFPQGKNHGMVMLVDWSGSMDGCLEDTVKQFITLAMFCRRAQIPYRVFLFSSQYDIGLSQVHKQREFRYQELGETGTLNNCVRNMALLEVFSDKMTNMEFTLMCKYLANINMFRMSKHGEYQTGGTPLNEALSYMVEFIPKFKKQYNIEKMSFITLTDGEGGALSPVLGCLDTTRYEDCATPEEPYARRKLKLKHFLQDPITKKSYAITDHGSVQTNAILQMIKDRCHVNTVGFYIVPNTRRCLSSAVKSNLPLFTGSDYIMIEDWRKEFRVNGFASIKNAGRDDLFIIPQNRMTIVDENLEIGQKQTAKQIAKTFTKHMTGKKTNRVLLNQFIGLVA